jgi:predicted ATP-grasp superfamily ATP-dependent carboligase
VALEKLEKTISSYCTIPTNTKTIQTLLSKQEQYKIAKTCGVHTPQTLHIKTKQDLNRAAQIPLPCIIKPLSSQTSELFRILDIQTEKERKQCFDQVLTPAIQNGHEFIASELIPGADNQIAAYVCFVTPDKQILGAYTGRKHTQCPENFGVFASAETEDIPELHTLGKKLVEGMNIHGIIEPEFKYDERDQTWKLMEVNFRSMMWNRVGWYQGVPLAYLQYCSATNTNPQISIKKNPTRIVYLRHQLRNLVHRPSYFSLLLAQYRKPWKPVIWNISDPLPGIYDTIYTLLILTKTICLKYFRS